MDRDERVIEDSSSPDTLTARSSSEEEKQKPQAGSTSGEYATAANSSSSLDTLISDSIDGIAIFSSGINTDGRKRGKFGAFKSSFRKSGIFKIKKRACTNESESAFAEADPEQDDKG